MFKVVQTSSEDTLRRLKFLTDENGGTSDETAAQQQELGIQISTALAASNSNQSSDFFPSETQYDSGGPSKDANDQSQSQSQTQISYVINQQQSQQQQVKTTLPQHSSQSSYFLTMQQLPEASQRSADLFADVERALNENSQSDQQLNNDQQKSSKKDSKQIKPGPKPFLPEDLFPDSFRSMLQRDCDPLTTIPTLIGVEEDFLNDNNNCRAGGPRSSELQTNFESAENSNCNLKNQQQQRPHSGIASNSKSQTGRSNPSGNLDSAYNSTGKATVTKKSSKSGNKSSVKKGLRSNQCHDKTAQLDHDPSQAQCGSNGSFQTTRQISIHDLRKKAEFAVQKATTILEEATHQNLTPTDGCFGSIKNLKSIDNKLNLNNFKANLQTNSVTFASSENNSNNSTTVHKSLQNASKLYGSTMSQNNSTQISNLGAKLGREFEDLNLCMKNDQFLPSSKLRTRPSSSYNSRPGSSQQKVNFNKVIGKSQSRPSSACGTRNRRNSETNLSNFVPFQKRLASSCIAGSASTGLAEILTINDNPNTSQMNQTSNSCNPINEDLNQCQNQNSEFDTNHNGMQSNSNAEHMAHVLANDRNQLQKKLEKYEKEQRCLKARVSALQAERQALQSTQQSSNRTVQLLQQKLQESDRRYAGQKTTNENQQRKIKSLQVRIEQLMREKVSLESGMEGALALTGARDTEVQRLESENKVLLEENEQLKKENLELERQNDVVMCQLDAELGALGAGNQGQIWYEDESSKNLKSGILMQNLKSQTQTVEIGIQAHGSQVDSEFLQRQEAELERFRKLVPMLRQELGKKDEHLKNLTLQLSELVDIYNEQNGIDVNNESQSECDSCESDVSKDEGADSQSDSDLLNNDNVHDLQGSVGNVMHVIVEDEGETCEQQFKEISHSENDNSRDLNQNMMMIEGYSSLSPTIPFENNDYDKEGIANENHITNPSQADLHEYSSLANQNATDLNMIRKHCQLELETNENNDNDMNLNLVTSENHIESDIMKNLNFNSVEPNPHRQDTAEKVLSLSTDLPSSDSQMDNLNDLSSSACKTVLSFE